MGYGMPAGPAAPESAPVPPLTENADGLSVLRRESALGLEAEQKPQDANGNALDAGGRDDARDGQGWAVVAAPTAKWVEPAECPGRAAE